MSNNSENSSSPLQEDRLAELNCTGVNVEVTLKRLEELAKEHDNSSEKKEEFETIAENVTQLKKERDDLHDQLEIETMFASKKRIALQVLPGKYNKEMEDAVLNARRENEEILLKLQNARKQSVNQAQLISSNSEKTVKQNVKLKLECDQIRKEHDEIIAQLNQRMSKKARKQIVLNETRDKLREVQRQTSEIDVGLLNLEDDLNVERNEAALQNKDLEHQIAETESAITLQNQMNVDEKSVTDDILEKVMDVKLKIEEKRKDVQRLENTHMRLEVQVMTLSDKIDWERTANKDTLSMIEKLKERKQSSTEKYEKSIDEINKKLEYVQTEVIEARKVNADLLQDKEVIRVTTDAAISNRSRHSALVKEMKMNVDHCKEDANRLIESLAELTFQGNGIRQKMENLEKNHRATVETFNSQITECKDSLTQEQEDRLRSQAKKEESEKVLEKFQTERTHYLDKMQEEIAIASKQQEELTKQKTLLSRKMSVNYQAISGLETKYEISLAGFRTMKSSLEMEVERLISSKEFLSADNKRKSEYLEEKTPVMESLREELDEITEDYNFLKREVINVRNREKSVNEQIKRTQTFIDKLKQPTADVRALLKEARIDGQQQLLDQAEEHKRKETEIYNITNKLETIDIGSSKIAEASAELYDEVEILKLDLRSNAIHQMYLHKEILELEEVFSKAWSVCIGMEENSAVKDKEVLDGIAQIQVDTKNRSEALKDISANLKRDLEALTGFVHNVSDRRPKDTRQAKRKTIRESGHLSIQRDRLSSSALRSPLKRSSTSFTKPSTPALLVKPPSTERMHTLQVPRFEPRRNTFSPSKVGESASGTAVA